jgi:hypothetical protein
MRGQTKGVVGAAFAIAAVSGVGLYLSLRSESLPDPAQPIHREVFPELDFRGARVGSSLERIYGSFGRKGPAHASDVPTRRCVYFKYDPELYDGALVVLVDGALVQQRWLLERDTKPPECSGLPEEAVDLRGWYAAAVG